jgi:hypothetical protein
VAVLAKDAETGQPIPGAKIRITYPGTTPSFAPWESSGVTGPDGVAHLQAAPYGNFGINLAGQVQGYLFEERDIPIKEVEAIAPAQLFEAVDHRPVNYVVALYADPRPTVELVLPAGYRGLVKADLQPREDIPCPPGQRTFRYNVPSTGAVTVSGPLLLKRVLSANFDLKFADGVALNWTGKDSEIGFWWLKAEGPVQVFFVGTHAEFNAEYGNALRNAADRAGGQQPANSGRGGGRGRRHGGGGGSGSGGP